MATKISLKNKTTGQTKAGYYGFSWTTFFFAFFPALFRGEFLTFIASFVIWLIVASITFGFGACLVFFVWAFMYNKYSALNLIQKGFMLNGTHEENKQAAMQLGIELTESNCTTFGQ